MSVRTGFIVISIVLSAIICAVSIFVTPIWWAFIIIGPLILLGIYDMLQKKHAILRNYPVLGNMRYLLESIRPEIMQYFVETDTEGRPFNRLYRNIIYQRAKDVNDTAAFGTQMNVYKAGYEWMDHSIYAKSPHDLDHSPRIKVGSKDCKQPYEASILNVSAMSFGSLSSKASMALNKGAKLGNFAQNTGEGGLSPYHLEYEGDVIWQIGTGYFGCRNQDGTFSDEFYSENANKPSVKMIELKLSQGAKPGHGGILPAAKNTEEIGRIRGVKPGTDVISPPAHTEFSNAVEMLKFIQKLRDLSNGKPIGIKLCIGKESEFEDICKAILDTNIYIDFIAIDGGEGGTGAAPIEFSNSIGTPLRDGLVFANDTLVKFGIRKEIKLIAAGKIVTGFHMARALALGADICYSARAMMMALGCIQALQCNRNTCPVGIATQNKQLQYGLNVDDKGVRVANYHKETVISLVDLCAAVGLSSPDQLERKHINRRIGKTEVSTLEDLFPTPIIETQTA